MLVPKIPGQGWVFSFGQVVTWTPQMYGLWTPLDELMSMVLFLSLLLSIFEILSKISILNSLFFISTFLITTFHYYYIIKLGFCDIHTSSISSLDCGLLHFACKFFSRITNSHKKISACGGQKTMKCSLRSRRLLRSLE